MTPAPLPRDATSQPGRAAGIGAVALAVLVAIAVAALFLVLIGADRSDRLVAPSSDVAHAQLAKTQAPTSRSRSSPLRSTGHLPQPSPRTTASTTNKTHEQNTYDPRKRTKEEK